jgi:hypothetical protein
MPFKREKTPLFHPVEIITIKPSSQQTIKQSSHQTITPSSLETIHFHYLKNGKNSYLCQSFYRCGFSAFAGRFTLTKARQS